MKIIQIAGGDENSYPWALDSEGNVYEWTSEGSLDYSGRVAIWQEAGSNGVMPKRKQGWQLKVDTLNE